MVLRKKLETPLEVLLSNIRNKPPKKLSPSVISEIHSKIACTEDLDNVISSGFLRNVAWKFFHEDVTNSHLELILASVFYEAETYTTTTCWETLTEGDGQKLQLLVLRILQSTIKANDMNHALETCSFLFLSALARYNMELLKLNTLFEKWLKTVLDEYTTILSEGEVSPIRAQVSESLLYFCVSLVTKTKYKEQLHEIRFACYFSSVDLVRVQKLALILKHYTGPAPDFTSFQLAASNIPGLEQVAHCPLKYDIAYPVLVDILRNIPGDVLASLAETTGYKEKKTSQLLVEVVASSALESSEQITNVDAFTEEDIFDIFDTSKVLTLAPPPIAPTDDFISPEDYLVRVQSKIAYELKEAIHKHLKSVFERTTVQDPSTEQGLKSSSKYFSRIQGIKVEGSRAIIEPSSKSWTTGLEVGDRIVLVELQKPNKLDGHARMAQNGIYSARVATITNTLQENIQIRWTTDHFESRFNAVIKLMPIIRSSTLEKVNNAAEMGLQNSLEAVFSTQTYSLDYKVNCIDKEIAEKLANKGKEEPGSLQTLIYENSKLEICPSSGEILDFQQTEALLTMVNNSVLRIDSQPQCGAHVLINAFLETLHINWPQETCLVVLPTQAALSLMSIYSEFNDSIKYGENLEELNSRGVTKRIETLLNLISSLSDFLELGEYDFGSSITNALMLYDAHIVPKWEEYLHQLDKLTKSISKYPFGDLKYPETESVEKLLTKVVAHYSNIKSTFAQLQSLLPWEKVVSKANIYLAHHMKYVFASVEDLPDTKFDNVVSLTSEDAVIFPVLTSKVKRLVLFKSTKQSLYGALESDPVVLNDTYGVRDEIAQLVGLAASTKKVSTEYNPGFRNVTQLVKVGSSMEQVNVEEAQYCVSLFQYMRLLGYPHEKILLVVTSPYMRLLVEEILVERKIKELETPSDTAAFRFGWPIMQNLGTVFSCDYMIVSLHGSHSLRAIERAGLSAKLGLYFVGSDLVAPFKVPSGELSIYTGASYRKGTDGRDSSQLYELESAEHIGDYVMQMTKTRCR